MYNLPSVLLHRPCVVVSAQFKQEAMQEEMGAPMSTLPRSFAKLSEMWTTWATGNPHGDYAKGYHDAMGQCKKELDALIAEWAAHTIECYAEPSKQTPQRDAKAASESEQVFLL